jgi:hypothetical protein
MSYIQGMQKKIVFVLLVLRQLALERLGSEPARSALSKVVVTHELKLGAVLTTTKDLDGELSMQNQREDDGISEVQMMGGSEPLPTTA